MTAPKSSVASAKTMNTVIHAAFRRDLQRFDGALASAPAGSQWVADLLHASWTNFSDQLRHHHHEEEEIFFPALRGLGADALLLAELTKEHDRMLAALDATEEAMGALHVDPSTARAQDAGAAMAELASAMQVHLDHEERDLEPFSARHASALELKAAEKAVRTRARRRVGTFIAWLTDGADPADIAVLRRTIPPPALFLAGRIGGRHYRRTIAVAWSRADGANGADGADG